MAFKPFDLAGKNVVITGGNGGIGLGMAQGVAQAGANVCIWGRNKEKNASAHAALAKHGTKILSFDVDVAQESAVIDAMNRAISELGRVDAVFANAGDGGGGARTMMDISAEKYRRVMQINIDGVFHTLREGARHMKSREGGGLLVGVSSIAAFKGMPGSEHYSATKGAVVSMVNCMAIELASVGIRANCILPGPVHTDITAPMRGNEDFNKFVMRHSPMNRWGQPEEFGGIAVYLTSEASSFHTGDSFVIDGGFTQY